MVSILEWVEGGRERLEVEPFNLHACCKYVFWGGKEVQEGRVKRKQASQKKSTKKT